MNKRGDSKVESNDSPEIPDRVETSDIPGLPSGQANRANSSDLKMRRTTDVVNMLCHRQGSVNVKPETFDMAFEKSIMTANSQVAILRDLATRASVLSLFSFNHPSSNRIRRLLDVTNQ